MLLTLDLTSQDWKETVKENSLGGGGRWFSGRMHASENPECDLSWKREGEEERTEGEGKEGRGWGRGRERREEGGGGGGIPTGQPGTHRH